MSLFKIAKTHVGIFETHIKSFVSTQYAHVHGPLFRPAIRQPWPNLIFSGFYIHTDNSLETNWYTQKLNIATQTSIIPPTHNKK